jgi:hypothetical protein
MFHPNMSGFSIGETFPAGIRAERAGRLSSQTRASVVLVLTLIFGSLPASAETSAPFYAYFVTVGDPVFQNAGGGINQPAALPRAILGRRPLRGHPQTAGVNQPGLQANCYSGDGTIPDFAAALLSSAFFGSLSSCSVGSSLNDSINVTTGDRIPGTATGTASGSMASITFSVTPSPETNSPFAETPAIAEFVYMQVFDSPVPPGAQLTFTYTMTGNIGAGVSVSSDCSDPSCSAGSGISPATGTTVGLTTITVGPVTIGPSGTYTVTAAMAFAINPNAAGPPQPLFAGPYIATINLACALQPIAAPDPGTIPALGLPGNNWSLNYDIGSDDGLEVTNVQFGNRSMAAQMSVPYVNITTSDFSANNCQLEVDGSGDCAGRLVYFQSGTSDVTALYVFINIPNGTSSCLAVTENFEFDPPAQGDKCEPNGNIGCARFYPTVKYEYFPDEDTKSVTEVDIPMRIQFTDGAPGSKLLPPNQGQYAAIGKDDNVSGLENFFNGNPVQKEVYIPGVIQNGAPGAADDYYQTYLTQIDSPASASAIGQPDCATCVQIHWRWPSMFADVPGFYDDNGGEPLVPLGSNQSVDVAMVAYPDNQQNSCSNLASGQQLAGNPSVFWYCGKGYQDSDTFFQHGGFFNPLSGTVASPNVTVTKGGFRINHATGQWGQTVTLTNNGSALTGPLALVLDSLTSGVTLANADGVTSNVTPTGTPYVFAPLDSFSQLGPGQSLTVTLEFNNPRNSAIVYAAQVYTGGLL